jgi:hypothetical protein
MGKQTRFDPQDGEAFRALPQLSLAKGHELETVTPTTPTVRPPTVLSPVMECSNPFSLLRVSLSTLLVLLIVAFPITLPIEILVPDYQYSVYFLPTHHHTSDLV